MVIRKAGINDIYELIKIRISYLKEDYGNISSEQIDQLKKQLKEYYINHIDKDMIAYIAEENNEIISSVFLVVIDKPANPTFISGKIGNILNVYTKTEYRKNGIAGKLLKLAVNEAREMKLSYLELKSTEAGFNLYKELGFEEELSDYVQMKFKL
ncbi:GNAT family N-acetyltransferase [Clostridium sp. C2-6-12]|uniref:GNAT family N-acetyltransferase n=1 Tax=Clostridium sp. C2-6-12 TaxID=2698832 RepID=UPI0013679E02|nr:GNAT family N-acetyltransferase [Clostridium sp. C2-6-12]